MNNNTESQLFDKDLDGFLPTQKELRVNDYDFYRLLAFGSYVDYMQEVLKDWEKDESDIEYDIYRKIKNDVFISISVLKSPSLDVYKNRVYKISDLPFIESDTVRIQVTSGENIFIKTFTPVDIFSCLNRDLEKDEAIVKLREIINSYFEFKVDFEFDPYQDPFEL